MNGIWLGLMAVNALTLFAIWRTFRENEALKRDNQNIQAHSRHVERENRRLQAELDKRKAFRDAFDFDLSQGA